MRGALKRMSVQIGTKAHNFSDPTGLLSDCHRRIEMFLSTLEVVAAVMDRPASEETNRALESALHYFGQAAPKHNADEEDSLFPRLRQIQHADIQSSFSQLERLEEEHRWAAPLHAEVERLGTQYISTGSLSDTEIGNFRSAVTRLASMYKQHIDIEDSVIFPLAERLLPEADKTAIAEEMANRRGAKMVNL
jgi:hemerythrin-like domain-containing protein